MQIGSQTITRFPVTTSASHYSPDPRIILADRGEVVGLAAPASDERKPISAILQRSNTGYSTLGNSEVSPVLIRTDALVNSAPMHDLFASPQPTDITSNGSTLLLPNGGVELTTGLQNQEGSVFYTQALSTTGSFELHFTYDLKQSDTTPQGDGFGFAIQNAGPSAQGAGGGQVGFGGLPGRSVGVLMRSYTNDLLQISTDGNIGIAQAVAAYPTGQLSEAIGTEDITYDASTHLLTVTATPVQGEGNPVTLSTTIDLATLLGPTAWFGFVGATGSADSIETIDGSSMQIGTQTIVGFPGENVPCFCPGTLILTDRGEVAVEALAIGDRVVTTSGEQKPIRWIGRRVVATRFADPISAMPVRIRAGALSDSVPVRDVLLSPCHAVLVEDILVQAGALVNGRSIVRVPVMPETFTYYHIELADHTLILADGMPTETFIDNVDRMAFDNWAEHQALFGKDVEIVELAYPRAKSTRQVPASIRARLAARATADVGSSRAA